MEQTVLVNVKVEGTENEARVDSLTQSIIELQNANKQLAETNKALAKAEGDNTKAIVENAKQIEFNKQKLTENTAERKGLIQSIVAEDNSIKALSIRNANLIKERNLINTSTDEGRKRINAINTQLDSNNKIIKENSSALEKQRLNIGNYASALDGVIPGLGGMVSGIQSATVAAKAFIATPVGAVLAAVALALSTVIKFFKGSEEGQDALAKVTERLSFVFEQLGQIAENVGEILFKSFSFVGDLAFKILDAVAPAAAQALQNVLNAADQITKLEDEIDARENEMIIRRAETNRRVQELREKAIKEEGDTKRKTIQEAIDLEKQLAKEEVFQAEERLRLLELNIAKRGKATEEEKKQRAEAIAAVNNAEAQAFQSTIRFQKELERLNDEFRKNEAEKRQIDAANKRAESETAVFEERTLLEESQEAEIELNTSFNEAILSANKSFRQRDLENKKKQDALIISQEQAKQQQMSMLLSQAFMVGRQLAGQNKALQSGLALVSTYFSAQKAFESQFLPIPTASSPVRGAIAAALAVVSGLANVAAINGIQFARGGIAAFGGVLNGPSHAHGGIPFAVGGRVGFEAEGGEAIINKRSTAMFRPILSQINQAGGGRSFATGGMLGNEVRTASLMASSAFNASELAGLVNQVKTVLVLQDFEAVQNSRDTTVNKAQVLG